MSTVRRCAARIAAAAIMTAAVQPVLAAEPGSNAWIALGNGTIELPEKGEGIRAGTAISWIPDRDIGVIGPLPSEKRKTAPGQLVLDGATGNWSFAAGSTAKDWVVDMWDSPRAQVYLPGLRKMLHVRQEWGYSQRKGAAGWLADPQDWSWVPLEAPLSMSDASSAYNPFANQDGKRLPLWGSACYDAANQEAVSVGGGGVWGRVGEEAEDIAIGGWFFDAAAKRIRCRTADDAAVKARRWYPGNCGTWLFSERDGQWRALPQPLAQQPSGRILPGMAYDTTARKIVLFGGDDLSRCLDDTWLYDCATRRWSRAATTRAPRARAHAAMVHVPDQQAVLLAGGYAAGWQPLKDVWVFSTATATWTRLDLDLPEAAVFASAAYDAKRRRIVLVAYPGTGQATKLLTLSLKLDLGSARAMTESAAAQDDWHSLAWKRWPSPLPDGWLQGPGAPGTAAAGLAEIAALPANTWTTRSPPVKAPARGWGSYIYDASTHTAFAWGGGHGSVCYPGAEIGSYDVVLNRWQGMAEASNYNPIWLHGMVGGPPGVSLGGWSLLPSHARKSYGYDPVSQSVITYAGDIYSPKHRRVVSHIGPFPIAWSGPAAQVSCVTTPQGLYGFASEPSSKGSGWLCRANARDGVWEVVDKTGPGGHTEHDFLVHDAMRDRLLYLKRDSAAVHAFDLKSRTWTQEQPNGKAPARALGDGTYLPPPLDAVLLISGEGKETMYLYKCAERRWYTSPYLGAPAARGNTTGRDFSPVYDPKLGVVVRLYESSMWIGTSLLRLDPAALALTPIE